MSHFRLAAAYTAGSLALAGAYGGGEAVVITAALGCMEVALSMDNAVVNARGLERMNTAWRTRFLTWGLLIGVLGMRLVFPLAIVSVSAWISPWAALGMALHRPDLYAQALSAAQIQITGFGGAFLLMLFFDFFVDEEKTTHWIGPVEHPLVRLGHVTSISVALTVLVLLGVSLTLPDAQEGVRLLQCGMGGIVGYILAEGAAELIGAGDEEKLALAKAGFAGFMFLEIQDASFSFDGVIGALAVSKDIVIIALGLGIGAMFVRSLTLFLVEKGSLRSLPYLEHGAFWAIGAMAALMFAKLHHEIPDVLSGVVMAGIIGAALVHSDLENPDGIVSGLKQKLTHNN